MAKSNGNGSNGNGAHPGSSVVDLAAAVAGKRAAIASLEEAAAALVAERAETETRLSGLRAAVHVAGDKGKADDLKGANARLQVIADSLDGHAFQVATYRAELAGLEAELESVERLA